MDSTDLDRFRLKPGDAEKLLAGKPKTKRQGLPRTKNGEWFLGGSIPGPWLEIAAKLPGKALHVALAVWHVAKISQGRSAKLSHAALGRLGVGRQAARRALRQLEIAGLIEVDRRNCQAPRVTIATRNESISDRDRESTQP